MLVFEIQKFILPNRDLQLSGWNGKNIDLI